MKNYANQFDFWEVEEKDIANTITPVQKNFFLEKRANLTQICIVK